MSHQNTKRRRNYTVEDEDEAAIPAQLEGPEDLAAVQGYQFEPVTEAAAHADDDADILVQRRQREEIMEEFRDTRWCTCGNCRVMPTREQNVCCRAHRKTKEVVESNNIKCFTYHDWVDELLREGPLHMEYARYLQHHDNLFPDNPTDNDVQKRKRFCSYRTFIFWLYPGLKRRQRRPLPTCVYAHIQDRFPAEGEDEDDWRYSEFVYA